MLGLDISQHVHNHCSEPKVFIVLPPKFLSLIVQVVQSCKHGIIYGASLLLICGARRSGG